MDGVASAEDRLVFMTTNHMEALDPALIRPGRVDVVQRIGDATSHQCERMWIKFFPSQPNHAAMFASSIMSLNTHVSMAALQGYFLQYKDDVENALFNIKQLEKDVRRGSSDGVSSSSSSSNDDNDGDSGMNSSVVIGRISGKGKGYRSLTIDEVDKMPFNPQEGWDDNIANAK